MNSEVEILLVEDNQNDAELTIRALRKANVANNLYHVHDGAAAIDFLFGLGSFTGRNINNKPKVILLDLKMPKVDGIEVLTRIKSDDHTRQIPVVVLTSSKEHNDIENSYLLGANSYIVKPVDFEEFIQSVTIVGTYWILQNQAPSY